VFRLNSGTGEISLLGVSLSGRWPRLAQRGGFRSERDASEALERALERVRKQRSPLTDSNRRPPLYEEGLCVIHEGAGLVKVTDCGR
jgi:hypothetical protein